jgi:hypothetical protein
MDDFRSRSMEETFSWRRNVGCVSGSSPALWSERVEMENSSRALLLGFSGGCGGLGRGGNCEG